MEATTLAAQDPPFLRENWKRLTSYGTSSKEKVVRVKAGVATLLGRGLILRSPLKEADGVYRLRGDNSLSRDEINWEEYPDLDLAAPHLRQSDVRCKMSNEHVGMLVAWVTKVIEVDGSVFFDKDGACMRQNSTFKFNYPFSLSKEILLDSRYLKVALVEMLRYPFIYVYEHGSDEPGNHTLVFGHNWSSCAVLRAGQRFY